jgi:cutinase
MYWTIKRSASHTDNIQSQGTAVMHNAVSALPPALKKKVVAGVLFGDTRNAKDKGQVPNYPKDQVQIFCDPQDGVCGGKLQVTEGHMVYMKNGDGQKAIAFLKSKIDPALSAAGHRFVFSRH